MELKRIPSLDGWRAISILVVLLGHQAENYSSVKGGSIFTYFDFAFYGVQVFFVISGFLITNLLMKEERKTGSVSLKDFYIRRCFRILPAFISFLAVVFIINKITHGPLQNIVWFEAIFFMMNIFWTGGVLGHIWSLSVEEQYYLFWPVLFTKKKINTVLPLIFIAIVPVLMVLNHMGKINVGRYSLLLNIDSIFIGALFAMYRESKYVQWIRKFRYPIIVLSFALIICERFSVHYSGILTIPFAHSLFGLTVMLLIGSSMKEGTVLYKMLNTRVLIFIGQMSYSLYLWQQLFMFSNPLIPAFLTTFPMNYVCSFALAYLSSNLIEKPFLKLRTKFA